MLDQPCGVLPALHRQQHGGWLEARNSEGERRRSWAVSIGFVFDARPSNSLAEVAGSEGAENNG